MISDVLWYHALMTEIWKTIIAHPDYEVSNLGRVRSFRRGKPRILKPRNDGGGYLGVALFSPTRKEVKVHQLVLHTFVGPPLPEQECRHLNGMRDDNRVENLKWGTRKEQAADRKRHGTAAIHADHGMAKLTEAEVVMIRKLYGPPRGRGYRRQVGVPTQAEIANLFGVAQTSVARIIANETWRG